MYRIGEKILPNPASPWARRGEQTRRWTSTTEQTTAPASKRWSARLRLAGYLRLPRGPRPVRTDPPELQLPRQADGSGLLCGRKFAPSGNYHPTNRSTDLQVPDLTCRQTLGRPLLHLLLLSFCFSCCFSWA